MSRPDPQPSQILLTIAIALTSAGALVVEIVAGRMIAPYVGMSLYTWTAIIAVVLAGLSIGHWLGGRFGGPPRARAVARIGLALAGAAVFTALAPALLRVTSGPLLGGLPDPVGAVTALCVAVLLVPSLLAGFVSPILTRLALETAAPEQAGRVLGRMFAAGAAGSIAGVLVAGYVMIAWLGSSMSMLATAGVYLVLGIIFLALARPRTALATAFAGAAGLVAMGLARESGSGPWADPCIVESRYYCIRVVQLDSPGGGPARLMVLDHMGHGINLRDRPSTYHSAYVALTDLLVRRRNGNQPFSAYFIGGGAYTLPRGWAGDGKGNRITVAEIDPAVSAVAQREMWVDNIEHINVVHSDARRHLSALPDEQRFDAIIGDAFHDFSVPAHLATLEFFQLVDRRLTADGIFTMTVIDVTRRPLFLAAVVATLSQVFPDVHIWFEDDEFLTGTRSTFLVTASRRGGQADRLSEDHSALRRTWTSISAERLLTLPGMEDRLLLTDDHAPVDRLLARAFTEDL